MHFSEINSDVAIKLSLEPSPAWREEFARVQAERDKLVEELRSSSTYSGASPPLIKRSVTSIE